MLVLLFASSKVEKNYHLLLRKH